MKVENVEKLVQQRTQAPIQFLNAHLLKNEKNRNAEANRIQRFG